MLQKQIELSRSRIRSFFIGDRVSSFTCSILKKDQGLISFAAHTYPKLRGIPSPAPSPREGTVELLQVSIRTFPKDH